MMDETGFGGRSGCLENEPFACILLLLGQRLAPQQGEPLHLDRSCAQPVGNQWQNNQKVIGQIMTKLNRFKPKVLNLWIKFIYF